MHVFLWWEAQKNDHLEFFISFYSFMYDSSRSSIECFFGVIMSQNKRKKLSLDEARDLFADPADKRKQQRRSPRSPQSSRSSRPRSYPSQDQSQVKKRISMLERRVMEGNLNNDEEEQVLKQIGQLESQLG